MSAIQSVKKNALIHIHADSPLRIVSTKSVFGCHVCQLWTGIDFVCGNYRLKTRWSSHINVCKSVLEAVQLPARDETTSDLHTALFNLSQQCALALQWILSHCERDGNEEADTFYKEGSKLRQFPHHISNAEAKTLVKNHFHQNWKQRRDKTAEDTSLRQTTAQFIKNIHL